MLRRRKSREADLDRELRSHLDLEAEEQRQDGLSPEDARYAAYTETNVPAGARPLWNVLPTNPVNAPQWLRTQAARPTIQTIILTDPFGDLTAQENPNSTASLNTLLGPRWKLVHEESYPIYFEWRFYIFHVWRTRVWQRMPATPA